MSSDQTLLIAFIVIAFSISFPLIWCGVVLLISRLGGWNRLAKRFAAGERRPGGVRHAGIFGRIGMMSYKFTLIVHFVPEGFFLETSPFFRIGHPRLFIPWSEVRRCERRKLVFRDVTELSIGSPELAKVTLALELPEVARILA